MYSPLASSHLNSQRKESADSRDRSQRDSTTVVKLGSLERKTDGQRGAEGLTSINARGTSSRGEIYDRKKNFHVGKFAAAAMAGKRIIKLPHRHRDNWFSYRIRRLYRELAYRLLRVSTWLFRAVASPPPRVHFPPRVLAPLSSRLYHSPIFSPRRLTLRRSSDFSLMRHALTWHARISRQ